MRKKLGEILIASGSVTQADIDLALMDQASGDASRLGEQLVGLGKLTPKQLAKALSQQHSIPLIELPPIPPEVLAAVPMDFQVRHRLVPFRVSADSVSVGMADPADEHVLEELRASLNKKIMRYVVAGDAVDAAHASLGQATVELPAIAPHVAPVGARRASSPPTAQELFDSVDPPAAGLGDELFSGLDLPPPTTADVAPPPTIAPVSKDSAVIEIREEEEPEFYESIPVVPVAHVPPPPSIAPSPTPRPPPPPGPSPAGPPIFELDPDLPVTTPASEGLTSSPSGSFAIDVRDSAIDAPASTESFEVSLGSGDYGPAPAATGPDSADDFFTQTAPPQEESVALEQLPGELNASDEASAPLPFPFDEPPPASAPAPPAPKPSLPSWLGSSGSSPGVPVGAAEWTGELDDVPPSRLIAGAVRALVEKGLVTEAEILAALAKKKS